MATKEDVAAFLRSQDITLGFTSRRSTAEQAGGAFPWSWIGTNAAQPALTHDQLGLELMHLAEFRALQLGTFFGTPDGQLIAEGVSMVIPPPYKLEYDLVVNGLMDAAMLQQRGDRADAGKFALVLGGVVTCLILITTFGRGSSA